jgi:hypothetical protein
MPVVFIGTAHITCSSDSKSVMEAVIEGVAHSVAVLCATNRVRMRLLRTRSDSGAQQMEGKLGGCASVLALDPLVIYHPSLLGTAEVPRGVYVVCDLACEKRIPWRAAVIAKGDAGEERETRQVVGFLVHGIETHSPSSAL